MPCRPPHGLGRAAVLFTCEGTYQLSGGKAISEGLSTVIAGWLNPDQPTSSGRCRASLTPT
ncbi:MULTISPECIES: hypothetical protein [Cyanophyceae]|uniref:Uncharacterized protein n=1 Tax=Stenomitos frigidus AS-A4 TaxID=2933935 RepID=A0ABV0KR29_9CYAN|nr:hypothetical protein [Phormidium sp. FACHB-592]